jgi:hypothetical protein
MNRATSNKTKQRRNNKNYKEKYEETLKPQKRKKDTTRLSTNPL